MYSMTSVRGSIIISVVMFFDNSPIRLRAMNLKEEAHTRRIADQRSLYLRFFLKKKNIINNSRASLKSLNWNLRCVNHIIIGHRSEEEPETAATTVWWLYYVSTRYRCIGVVEYTRTSRVWEYVLLQRIYIIKIN